VFDDEPDDGLIDHDDSKEISVNETAATLQSNVKRRLYSMEISGDDVRGVMAMKPQRS
jgi:hypothetical protein